MAIAYLIVVMVASAGEAADLAREGTNRNFSIKSSVNTAIFACMLLNLGLAVCRQQHDSSIQPSLPTLSHLATYSFAVLQHISSTLSPTGRNYKMVKNRGVDVSIVSQFDIRRLPEFDGPQCEESGRNNAVNCYVPIYPGSQIWFEYTIEPPHPPKAAYFFKLLVNGQTATAWDCTEKHGYHGKMIYMLEKTETPQAWPRTSVQRKGFRFCNQEDVDEGEEDSSSNCLAVHVHRIEHRKRIRNHSLECHEQLDNECGGRLQYIDHCFELRLEY